MFFHNLKYTIKSLFRNKGLIFWTYAFPIFMATLFNMAFSNWDEAEKFEPIAIAIINNECYENNVVAKNVFNSVSKKDKNQIFEITYTNKEKASDLLRDKKIDGYIEYKDNDSIITVESNSFTSTIIKSVVDEIDLYNIMFNDLVEKKMEDSLDINEIITNIINKISNIKVNTKDISTKKLDISIIEYYSLLSMACLYGGFISLTCISNSLATISSKGKRVEVAPVKKSITILSSLVASFLTQMFGAMLLLGYYYILRIDLQVNILKLLLITILGVLAGISLGLVIAVISNKNEDTKLGIIIAVSMACSVFAGLTGVSLKYLIDIKFPFLNKINPAAMMTDGLYSLYYNDINRFNYNVISLIIFTIILVIISIITLRRKKNDNI